MNFGVLCSYDKAECTGPHRSGSAGTGSGWNSLKEWDQYGFVMGCSQVGDWPHADWTSGKTYEPAVWYSLAGKCPAEAHDKASDSCGMTLPGGLCDDPTGAGNCTYSYKPAGDIDIDELVGIKEKWGTRANFCRKCHSEGSAWSRGGCGLR